MELPTQHTFGFEWEQVLEENILKHLGTITCAEIIPENFLEDRFSNFLSALNKSGTPVSVHGVLLSIGAMEPLREDHLEKVLDVAEQVNMVCFSEHLSMTEVAGIDMDALTPLAWDEEVVDFVSRKIDTIQKRLKVPFLVENVANRFEVPDCEYSETEFINRVLEKTGCSLLLDVTNTYTNSVNFGFDPFKWIDEINKKAVKAVHLAGGYREPDGFLQDSHDSAIAPQAWELYRYLCERTSPFMTIIERTGNFPRFEDLLAELDRAKEITALSLRKEIA